MPRDNWLFDEQGRMRRDLPPLLSPDGNALADMPEQNSLGDTSLLERLEIAPDELGGWKVKYKQWDATPGGEPHRGLFFRRDFDLLSGGRR